MEQIFDKQEVGRRKNVYRITETGEALFQELLEESGPESSGEDNRFRVRMAFFKYLSPETRIRLPRTPAGLPRGAAVDHPGLARNHERRHAPRCRSCSTVARAPSRTSRG